MRSFVAFLALAGLLALPSLARAVTYNILAVSYTNGDTAIHIGSQVTVNMVVIAPVQQFNVSITAASTNTITLGSADFSSLFAPTQVYVSDGRRVWEMVYNPGSGFVTIGDGFLATGAPAAWQVGDYSTLANQSFRVFSGQKISELASGSNSVLYADLGAFEKIELSDDGTSNNGDAGFNDGIWSGVYNVQDLGFVITGARFYGVAGVDGIFADNQPFQSPQTIDLDCLRPAISTVQFTTNKQGYNGLLYLSRLSQDFGIFNPNSAQGRFDFTVNKRGVAVGIDIQTSPVKRLVEVTIPPSATNNNGWNTWDGQTGTQGVYAPDGTYQVEFKIRDFNDVFGLTKTTSVSVTSIQMIIENVALTPSGLQSEPAIVGGPLTTVSYNVKLRNDRGTSIQQALYNLGWNGGFNEADDHLSWAYTVFEADFLNPDGTVGIQSPGYDSNPNLDSDKALLYDHAYDLRFDPFAPCYFEGVNSHPRYITTTSGSVSTGDANRANDFDLVFPFLITNGTSFDVFEMSASAAINFQGNTPSPGSYRLRLRSILSSLEAVPLESGNIPDTANFCNPTALPSYLGRPYHFVPSAKRTINEGLKVSSRGKGISVEDSSILFSVSKTEPPTSDTTAPVVLSSDPTSDSEVEPNTYNSTRPISVQIEDAESAIAVDVLKTNLKLYYMSGTVRVPVGGVGNPDGGNPTNQMNLYFKPNVPITKGGTYVLVVNACNVNGLCISDERQFTVQDRSAPSVVAIELKLATQLVPSALTLGQTSPDGPFDNVTEVYAQLAMPNGSSNTIDWASSNISLMRSISNTTAIVPLVRVSGNGVPSDGRLRYRLQNSIDYAGLFEVVVQTFATDGSGNAFSGPDATFIRPRFTTQVNSNVFKVFYPLPSNGTFEAITGVKPITVTSSGLSVTLTSVTAALPVYGALAAATGYLPLTSTASAAHGFHFLIVGQGLVGSSTALRFTYDPSTPLRYRFYYDDSDLVPLGVSKTALNLLGYNGSAWSPVTGALHDATSGTRNSFTVDAPQSADSAVAYGIFYSVPSAGPGALPTATAIPFKHTRSFNPTHRDPIYRKARFFYSGSLPREVDVRIFDSGGTLVKAMSLGNGVNLGDYLVDSTYGVGAYFFEWDGRNDSGTLVRNGLYLARWKVVRADGSSETVVKPLALIK